MNRLFVIHYNELGLKKGNRDYFEKALCANMNSALQGCGAEKARRISGRVLLPLEADADLPEIKKRLSQVFGIAYFAEAWASPQSIDDLESNAWKLIEGRPFNSFRIEARRADKSFPLTSVEINQRVGAYVKERSEARVDLENAELTCWIETRGAVRADLCRATSWPGRTAGWYQRQSRGSAYPGASIRLSLHGR